MSTARIREAIERVATVITAQPEKARVKNAPATASLEDGLRCRVTGPAGELVHTDMPPGMGGGGTGPNPGWFMRAALASCNATGIAMRAAKLGVNLTKLEVSVSSESDSRGLLGLDENVSAALTHLRMHVKVSAEGASAEELRSLVHWVCSHSPVGCSEPAAATLEIQVE